MYLYLLEIKREIRTLGPFESQLSIAQVAERVSRVISNIKVFAADIAHESFGQLAVFLHLNPWQEFTLKMQDTPWVHRCDSVAISLVLLAVPGMAALRPDRTLKVLLGKGIIVADY